MPVCSKCKHDTLGHPKPYGAKCTWDGKPVEKDNTDDSNKFHSPEHTGSTPRKESEPTPPQKSPRQESPVGTKSPAPGSSTALSSSATQSQDEMLEGLMKRLKEAEDKLKAKKERKEQARKNELIVSITKRLEAIEKELAEPEDIPTVDPINSIYASAVQQDSDKQGNAPIANLAPVFSSMQRDKVGPPAHQVKAAAQPGLKTAPAQPGAPVAHPFINHDGTAQGIIQNNPLAKALTGGAPDRAADRAADEDDAEGKPYLPHDYVLKPGARDCKSVEELSFSEFVLAYTRMLEAMLQNNEPAIADRLDFFIRIVSECTHKRWAEVKELYLLFESEVTKKRKKWSDSFYGALEKLAYESSKNKQQGSSFGKQHHSGAVNHSGSEVKAPCKDFNWHQQGCSRPAVNCKYLHMCFHCWSSHGAVEGHRARDCPARNAAARPQSLTPNAQPVNQPRM